MLCKLLNDVFLCTSTLCLFPERKQRDHAEHAVFALAAAPTATTSAGRHQNGSSRRPGFQFSQFRCFELEVWIADRWAPIYPVQPLSLVPATTTATHATASSATTSATTAAQRH